MAVAYRIGTDLTTGFLNQFQANAAVADDGHKYDFVRLKEYIRAHIGQRLVSPITKEPMSAHVLFTYPVKNRYGNVIYVGSGEEKQPKLETITWQPTLNPPKPVA